MFIPANVALAAVSDTLEEYLKTPQPDLITLLEYHILAPTPNGPVYSSDFANATTLPTLANTSLEMRFFPNSYFVNQARIVAQDVLVYNGVFHVIDGVLSPDDANVMPNPTSATAVPVLPTNGGKVNGSEAPFSTYMPNYIPTDLPEVTTTASLDAYGYTSSTYGAQATSSKKSEAGRVLGGVGRGEDGGMLMMVLGGWVVLGLGSAVVFFGAL